MLGPIVPRNEHGVKDAPKQVEADLTAPDPGLEEEECADEWCHEPVFRDVSLCLFHYVEEETAAWDDQDAERQAALEGVGYVFGDPVIITENLEPLLPEEYECNRYRAAVVGGGLYGANKVEVPA